MNFRRLIGSALGAMNDATRLGQAKVMADFGCDPLKIRAEIRSNSVRN